MSHARLTVDDCRQWLNDSVFRLQPGEYCREYPEWPGLVGLELEMLVFTKASLSTATPKLMPLKGKGSISEVLVGLAKDQGWQLGGFDAGKIALSHVALEHKDQLTFEPGGQLEFSSKPYPCLSDGLERLDAIQSSLDKAFAAHGATILQSGINPWLTVDEIGLQMDKPRYTAMDKYFHKLSSYGRRMMRQTCTVQVNLDFGCDETTLAKRYLLANLMAPLATAIFANSPVVDRGLTKYKSFRSRVWRGLDATRTDFPSLASLRQVAQNLSKESCVESYLASLLAAKVVFIAPLEHWVPDTGVTFAAWLQNPVRGTAPTMDDFNTHISLHFPEVRPRGFLELRSVDCQSRVWQSVPASFYTAALYDNRTTEELFDLLLPYLDNLSDLLKGACFGLENPEIAALAKDVTRVILDGFKRLPDCFQGERSPRCLAAFAEHFTLRGRTPADDLVDAIKSSDAGFTPAVYEQVEDSWRRVSDG